ncbi:MAG: hypothetical protein M3169_07850 [Candidatus Eremiobacteraeota bacterium]|nr:hypothetical protein [Candidatus Eremiobacteraeota bacterium]
MTTTDVDTKTIATYIMLEKVTIAAERAMRRRRSTAAGDDIDDHHDRDLGHE